nr:hypothetical protein Itr_chr05CG03070 [Ipomoea trifida]
MFSGGLGFGPFLVLLNLLVSSVILVLDLVLQLHFLLNGIREVSFLDFTHPAYSLVLSMTTGANSYPQASTGWNSAIKLCLLYVIRQFGNHILALLVKYGVWYMPN